MRPRVGASPVFISKRTALLVPALIFSIVLGCTKKNVDTSDGFATTEFTKVRLSEPLHDTYLPEELWKKIELMAPPPGALPVQEGNEGGEKSSDKAEEKSGGEKTAPKKEEAASETKKEGDKKEAGKKEENGILVQAPDIPREPFAFRLQVRQKTKGVLESSDVEFQFPRGGGELDLSKVTKTGARGTYRLRLQYDLHFLKDEKMSVFFVPNSKQRTLNEEVFGNGCGRYFDVSHFFERIMTNQGVDLNTSDQRDVSAVAGTYFFIMTRGNLLYMSYLTVHDSRYPSLACRDEEAS